LAHIILVKADFTGIFCFCGWYCETKRWRIVKKREACE